MRRAILLLWIPLLACSDGRPEVQAAQHRLAISPSELDFGDVPVLGGRLQYVEVKNIGQAAVGVRTEIEGPFEVEPQAFGLHVGETQEVAVRFRPREAGVIDGGILFRTSSQNEFQLAAGGRGVERALELEPSEIDFGEVRVGESQKRSFTLVSVADGELRLLLKTGGSTDFSVDTQSFDLPGRGKAKLEVIFEPRRRGSHVGWLEISPCVDCAPVRIEFKGRAGLEGLQVGPSTFDFGVVPPGFSHQIEGWIRNDGDAPALVEALRLESSDPVFELDFDTSLPHELAPNEELALVLHFRPEAPGEHEARLFVSGANEEKSVEVKARSGGPILEAEALFVGLLPLGYEGEFRARIHVRGEDFRNLESLVLEDPSGTFTLPDAALPPAVGEEGLWIPVRVSGKAPGRWEATLEAHTGLRFQPVIEIPLRAHIAAPDCELRFDPPGPFHLAMVDGEEPLVLEVELTHLGEGECLIWDPRFENEDHAMLLDEGKVDGFLLLERGQPHLFRFLREPLLASVQKEVSTNFVLEHSKLGVREEIPISFLQAKPLPFTQASFFGLPDTPVGKIGIGWAQFWNRAGFSLDDPAFSVLGSEELTIWTMYSSFMSGYPLVFRPEEVGKKKVHLASWWRDHSQPYLHPLELEALAPCTEPCDWPKASCAWELVEVEWQGKLLRHLFLTAETSGGEERTCVWFRDDFQLSNDCEEVELPVYENGFSHKVSFFVFDRHGRGDICEMQLNIPPLGD